MYNLMTLSLLSRLCSVEWYDYCVNELMSKFEGRGRVMSGTYLDGLRQDNMFVNGDSNP
jgi:hypothetical protein